MQQVTDIAHIIDLSVAPVFLILGIGTLLNVMTTRLARVIDRSRVLESIVTDPHPNPALDRARDELVVLDKRMALSQRAIMLCTVTALLVCLIVAALFLSTLANFQIGDLIALTFIAAMACLIVGLTTFLAEVLIATRTIRVRAELLMKTSD